MNFNLNYDSVKEIIAGADQVMVYGWKTCGYQEIAEALKEKDSPVKKVFDFYVGDPNVGDSYRTTLEGNVIKHLPFDKAPPGRKNISRLCKGAINDIVMENYKRKLNGQKLIPLIFCYESEHSMYKPNGYSIASKDPWENELITNSELRRCYKLVCELKGPDLEKISEVAAEMIKFVKVKQSDSSEHKLEAIPPFWREVDFQKGWQERKLHKQTAAKSKNTAQKNYPWQKVLIDEVKQIDSEYAKKMQKTKNSNFKQGFIKLISCFKEG